MKVMTFTYHLMMRFPTEHGMGEVRGDQNMAQECYNTSLSDSLQEEAMIVNEEKTKKTSLTAELAEDLLELPLDDLAPD